MFSFTRILSFIVCILFALVAVSMFVSGNIGTGIFCLFVFAFFLIPVFLFKKPPGLTIKEKALKYNASGFTALSLISGLPLAENTSCQLFLTQSELIIEALSQQYTIALNQILAAQTKGDTEIIKEVTSSGGKALVGGLLFGPVGAIIGARTKTKKTAKVTFYLIINYINKNNETDVLAFTSGEGYPFSGQCDKISKPLTEWITAQRGGTVTAL